MSHAQPDPVIQGVSEVTMHYPRACYGCVSCSYKIAMNYECVSNVLKFNLPFKVFSENKKYLNKKYDFVIFMQNKVVAPMFITVSKELLIRIRLFMHCWNRHERAHQKM